MPLRLPEEPLWDGWRKGEGGLQQRRAEWPLLTSDGEEHQLRRRELPSSRCNSNRGELLSHLRLLAVMSFTSESSVETPPPPPPPGCQSASTWGAFSSWNPEASCCVPAQSNAATVFESVIQRAGKVCGRVVGEAVVWFFGCWLSKLSDEPP